MSPLEELTLRARISRPVRSASSRKELKGNHFNAPSSSFFFSGLSYVMDKRLTGGGQRATRVTSSWKTAPVLQLTQNKRNRRKGRRSSAWRLIREVTQARLCFTSRKGVQKVQDVHIDGQRRREERSPRDEGLLQDSQGEHLGVPFQESPSTELQCPPFSPLFDPTRCFV